MKTLKQLYNWFFLSPSCENMKISDWKIPLRVAPIKESDKYENLEIEYKHFAFAEKNQNWEIEYFRGLKNFLLIKDSDFPPVFIFDNHNHALSFRYEISHSLKSKWQKSLTLIHIDQHSDCRENNNTLKLNRDQNELEKIFDFCNAKCNVGNFVPPAIESWIISDQIQIRSTTAIKNLKIEKNQNFILDIDLDFCLDWINRNKVNQETVKLLKNKFDEIWKSALWITIATSPYFLDQHIAIEIIGTLLNNHLQL